MIVLDTNVVSEIQRPGADANVVAWFDAQSLPTLWLTTITVAELRYGVALLDPGRRRAALERLIETYVENLFAGRIAGFDLAATAVFADRAARARQQGREVRGFADAAIAAIALSRGFAVATRDAGPFRDMGVTIIDPWAPPA